jgi:hypothetical protein
MAAQGKTGAFTIKAYQGDAKTLLAFNLTEAAAKNLAGFTIHCLPKGQPPYFLHNDLRFERPGDHAQDPTEPANSTINAPIHKFRWVHVPGVIHQGLTPFFGPYTYTVTPRYFDDRKRMQPLDGTKSASLTIDVGPFAKGKLSLGFTRGYTQSQAFVNHFGKDALLRPAGDELLFDTTKVAGKDANGTAYTFAEAYAWLGFTARRRIFDLLDEVQKNKALRLDVFAYDLNEPDLMTALLGLGKQKRVRVILDNADLHLADKPKGSKSEDAFTKLLKKQAPGADLIKRGKFGRYAHDKVFIVADKTGPRTVLTGSTNFSVTGLYVNSNHVLVFDDRTVAGVYAQVFQTAWDDDVSAPEFKKTALSAKSFPFSVSGVKGGMTFAPHDKTFANQTLDALVARIKAEAKVKDGRGSVLFAVMQIDQGESPVYQELNAVHGTKGLFSFGISDGPKGISLYKVGSDDGVLVTGKPTHTQLPPPFNQVPEIQGFGHQIHHKFVVCGFNGDKPVVYCGSSNLAPGGETLNGDNLLEIHDGDVATVFAIEALTLVDHFNFLNRSQTPKGAKGKAKPKTPNPLKTQAAVQAGWFLATDDGWTHPYYDKKDLHCVDRTLFC